MDLLEIVGRHVFPSVHALRIEPFKSMWENDNSPDKEECLKIFTYIEFVCSPKKSNPYFGFKPEERPPHVKHEVFGDPDYPTTHDMLTGCMKYMELLRNSSPSFAILEDSLTTAEKLRTFLKTTDPGTRTDNGSLLLKPRDIASGLKEIPTMVLSLEETWKKVQTELIEDSKTRNNREIGEYER